MDFICGFYGFHIKSTWFHMKDQEKVKNVTWINCSYWFQVDFIMGFIKSNTILLKPKWFHEILNDFMKSNWILQRVTRFHRIHRSLQDCIKSRRFHEIYQDFTKIYRISLNPLHISLQISLWMSFMDFTANFMLIPPYFIIGFMTNFITSTRISLKLTRFPEIHSISLKSTGFHYGFHCGFHSCEICNEIHNEIYKWNPQWNPW